ncbi:hypothetical protein XW81_01205 [Buchnera aphidicola (Schlechtendalia chinensis)]|uniref:GTPase Era n=1 Tax=Buchnera aphidicola subsp. Schlechtendalia chinensis TaxID=118110 RepID=A0A172WDH3_BUCSC|nr:hypothetical protein XW81_01205 [Buchnera aphidicola (Schlechtendalia chinensis)]
MRVKQKYYCGTIVIVGKPNAGKSTIINSLVKTKVSIVSKRPHTTQCDIIGIQNDGLFQAIYIDTPGISYKHFNVNNVIEKCYINKLCNNATLILFVLDGITWTSEDNLILNLVKHNTIPVIAVINKNDKILQKNNLLPYIESLRKKKLFEEIVPISGKTGENIHLLSKLVQALLPISKIRFPTTQKTSYNLYFKVQEIIREKFIFYLGEEVSYSIRIIVESICFKEKKMYVIKALIVVKNNQHKQIIVGKKGTKIKFCGTLARQELEKYFKHKVYLSLFVKKDNKKYQVYNVHQKKFLQK